MEPAQQDAGGGRAPGFQFTRRRQFVWKTVLLAATTLSLVPILLMKSEEAAMWWLIALIVVHVVGIAILIAGTKRHHIAPDRRGLAYRVVAIVILSALLYLLGKGVTKYQVGDIVFWGILFAIWAAHTAGLLLLHVRTRREAKACPFA